MWKRKSEGSALSDEQWNSQEKAISKKSIFVDSSDKIGKTIFFCEVSI